MRIEKSEIVMPRNAQLADPDYNTQEKLIYLSVQDFIGRYSSDQ